MTVLISCNADSLPTDNQELTNKGFILCTNRSHIFVAFGQSLLQCIGCLLPFLEAEMIDTLPYLVASSMAVLPSSLHHEVVNLLCFYILPFTVSKYS